MPKAGSGRSSGTLGQKYTPYHHDRHIHHHAIVCSLRNRIHHLDHRSDFARSPDRLLGYRQDRLDHCALHIEYSRGCSLLDTRPCGKGSSSERTRTQRQIQQTINQNQYGHFFHIRNQPSEVRYPIPHMARPGNMGHHSCRPQPIWSFTPIVADSRLDFPTDRSRFGIDHRPQPSKTKCLTERST